MAWLKLRCHADIFLDYCRKGESDEEDEDEEEDDCESKVRRQAVFAMDMEIWREAIEEFGIIESIIPHRLNDATNEGPGARGCYG